MKTEEEIREKIERLFNIDTDDAFVTILALEWVGGED